MQRNEEFIYAAFSICLGAGVITFIAWMCWQMYKHPNPYPSLDEFDEKYEKILTRIGEATTQKEINEVWDYMQSLIENDFSEATRPRIALLEEHHRLRELQISGEIEEAQVVADRIEKHLKLLPGDEIPAIS